MATILVGGGWRSGLLRLEFWIEIRLSIKFTGLFRPARAIKSGQIVSSSQIRFNYHFYQRFCRPVNHFSPTGGRPIFPLGDLLFLGYPTRSLLGCFLLSSAR